MMIPLMSWTFLIFLKTSSGWDGGSFVNDRKATLAKTSMLFNILFIIQLFIIIELILRSLDFSSFLLASQNKKLILN